jgi:hypothetical protein
MPGLHSGWRSSCWFGWGAIDPVAGPSSGKSMSWRDLAFLAIGIALIGVAFVIALELLEEKHSAIVGEQEIVLAIG